MLWTHVEDELLDLALFDIDRREPIGGRVLKFAPLDLSGGYVLTALLNLSAAPRETLTADGVSSSRANRSSLTLTTFGYLFAKSEESFEERLGAWRTSRHVDVDGHDGVDALKRRVAVPELAT
jgi:hypothetical protein